METILNIGLTSKTIPYMIDASGNERFVYDSYRRLIMMYADVVMEKALKLNKSSRPIRELMEKELDSIKKVNGYKNDSNMKAKDWKVLSEKYLKIVKKNLVFHFLTITTNSFMELLPLSLKAGTEKEQKNIGVLKKFLLLWERL